MIKQTVSHRQERDNICCLLQLSVFLLNNTPRGYSYKALRTSMSKLAQTQT